MVLWACGRFSREIIFFSEDLSVDFFRGSTVYTDEYDSACQSPALDEEIEQPGQTSKEDDLESQVQVVYGFVGHGIRCDKTTAKDILKSRHEFWIYDSVDLFKLKHCVQALALLQRHQEVRPDYIAFNLANDHFAENPNWILNSLTCLDWYDWFRPQHFSKPCRMQGSRRPVNLALIASSSLSGLSWPFCACRWKCKSSLPRRPARRGPSKN